MPLEPVWLSVQCPLWRKQQPERRCTAIREVSASSLRVPPRFLEMRLQRELCRTADDWGLSAIRCTGGLGVRTQPYCRRLRLICQKVTGTKMLVLKWSFSSNCFAASELLNATKPCQKIQELSSSVNGRS